jgi:hypothetical protein
MPSASKLPAGFRYAGVISFAGAIFSTNKIKWHSKPAPMLFFHGNADRNVPCGKLKFMKFGLYGPAFLTKYFDKNNVPYYFHSFDNAEHEISTLPMKEYLPEIELFLQHFIIKKTPKTVTVIDKTYNATVKKKKITVQDCLNANFKVK